ncbi:tRNA-binding protein [Amphibiibacter pelophylacis]|uniref:tRNA-binding protein n=1 Tax=Amphibiibacter pelophylacis TaxID=1799477 RepID=A0ACC6P058_9BURK
MPDSPTPPAPITFDDFLAVDLRVGRVMSAEEFPQARRPAYILHVDFGPEIGVKKSSAQITVHYTPQDLVGRLVVGVVNFPPRQIGPIRSECLITGFHDASGAVRLCQPEGEVPLGARLL